MSVDNLSKKVKSSNRQQFFNFAKFLLGENSSFLFPSDSSLKTSKGSKRHSSDDFSPSGSFIPMNLFLELCNSVSLWVASKDNLLGSFPSFLSDFKLPQLDSIVYCPVSIGNFSIDAKWHKNVVLPPAFASHVQRHFSAVFNTANGLARTVTAYWKAVANHKAGKHFGAFSTSNAKDGSLACASSDTLKAFSNAVDELNKGYHKNIFSLVCTGYVETLTTLLKSFDSILKDFLAAFTSNTMDLLNQLDSHLLILEVFEHYLFCGFAPLFNVYQFASNCFLDLRLQLMNQTAKRAEFHKLVEEASADLMDVETNQQTIRDLVVVTVKDTIANMEPTIRGRKGLPSKGSTLHSPSHPSRKSPKSRSPKRSNGSDNKVSGDASKKLTEKASGNVKRNQKSVAPRTPSKSSSVKKGKDNGKSNQQRSKSPKSKRVSFSDQ